jgi:hypothetical protein
VSFGRYVVPHPRTGVVEVGTRLRRQAEPCVQCPDGTWAWTARSASTVSTPWPSGRTSITGHVTRMYPSVTGSAPNGEGEARSPITRSGLLAHVR